MIDKVLQETASQNKDEQLKAVLSRVKGIDLNPIAVLTARVNYFLNFSHLLIDNRPIDISVAQMYHQEKNYRNCFEEMLKALRKEGSFE